MSVTAQEVAPFVREAMEGAMTLRVPLKVNIKVGPDWEHLSELPKGTPGASPTLAGGRS